MTWIDDAIKDLRYQKLHIKQKYPGATNKHFGCQIATGDKNLVGLLKFKKMFL